MKKYTLSFADSLSHIPEHPERTAFKVCGWDYIFQVWPSAAAMQTTLHMQGKRAFKSTDWREWKPRNAK